MSDSQPENVFEKADYTAIVSDLHLCEEEPAKEGFPLWKKYKSREFFFDEDFRGFLDFLDADAKGKSIELILNGDIFDFDSVTILPDRPPYKVSWLEKKRGLRPQEEKSVFKIHLILDHHPVWLNAIKAFIKKGHRIVFIIGNHDLELCFPRVQETILERLELSAGNQNKVRFADWFYISNKDTLVEHGNQYDPYCVCEDPINPFMIRFNKKEVKVPFGNWATRYLINGMGFFNPHLDTNFIMTPKEYVTFFFKYIVRAQPFLLFTWLWGASMTLFQSFSDRLLPTMGVPLSIESRVEQMAFRANATPRMVREMNQLSVPPASSEPLTIAKELWLDRAFIVLVSLIFFYVLFLQISVLLKISVWWMLMPLLFFSPFFIFYSRSVTSVVHEYKEPREATLAMTGMITGVGRVIYGHTHIARHENIGIIEHLNSGTWSPAFEDVECTKPKGRHTFVWISPDKEGQTRRAELLQYKKGDVFAVFAASNKRAVKRTIEA